MFMRKYGEEIYSCLIESLALPSNTASSICSVYTTLALVALELITQHTLTPYLNMVTTVQVVEKAAPLSLSPHPYSDHSFMACCRRSPWENQTV